MHKLKNKEKSAKLRTRKNPLDLELLRSLNIEVPLGVPNDPIYAFKFGMVVGLKKAKQLMQTVSGRAKYFKYYIFSLKQHKLNKLKNFVIITSNEIIPDMTKIEKLLPSDAFNIGILFALNYSYGYAPEALSLYIDNNWSDSFNKYIV